MRLAAHLALRRTRQISQGTTCDFPPIHPPHLRRHPPDDIGLRVFWPSRPACRRLLCGSCTSDLEFAFRFLRIPSRDGHTLTVRLEVPVIKILAGTFIRPVNSRIAFAPRLQASMSLRVMPDTPKDSPGTAVSGLSCREITVVPSYFASAGAGLLAASNAALPSSVSRIYTSGFGVASAFSWPRIHLMPPSSDC
jgi:hypothetical protein